MSPKRLLGLDVGTSSVKGVELTRRGERLSVTAMAQAPVPSPAELPAAIREVLRRGSFHTRLTCSNLSGRLVTVKYITMPRMPRRELIQALSLEVNPFIPFKGKEVFLDAHPIAEAPPGSREMPVVMAVAKRDLVLERVGLLTRCGLAPAILDVDVLALGNAYELDLQLAPPILVSDPPWEAAEEQGSPIVLIDVPQEAPPEVTPRFSPSVVAVADVGASKTSVVVLLDETPRFSREIYMGGHDFTQAIARRLSLPLDAAEHVKRSPGGGDPTFLEAAQPVLEKLADEIRLSLEFFESQFDVPAGEICLSGGACLQPGLPEAVQRACERPARCWVPFQNLEGPGTDGAGGEWAVALGLASRLRGL